MRVNIRELLCFLTALLFAGGIHAETLLPHGYFAPPLRLGVEMPYSILADTRGEMNFAEVVALPAERFTQRQGGFSVGFSSNAYWLRVDLPAQVKNNQESWLALSPPFIDSIQVFEATIDGWKRHEGGDLLPLSSREMDYRDFVFRLKPIGDQPLYIRVASTSSVILYGALWEPAAFATHALPDARDWGLYFGAMAFSGIVLIGLVATFRQRRFIVLLFTCLFNYGMVAGLQGFHIWLLWPESPQLASMSLGVLVCLGSATAILLIRECLSLSRSFPRIDKLYLAASAILAVSALSIPLNYYHWVAGWVTSITELASLGACIMAVILGIRGNPLKLAFAVAFLVHFLAVAPAVAINLGLIPPSRVLHTLWQYELIAHMLAIAGIFLFEMRQAHRHWLSTQNDALLSTKEAKEMLESKVQDRTLELSLAQASLRSALDNERHTLFEHRQFMAMISHEFRTPLAIIDATANNLTLVPPRNPDDLAMRASQVLRAARRLTKLTDTCLADARLRDDAFSLQCANIDLRKLLNEAAEIVVWSPENTLVTDFEEAPESWLCDPALLRIAVSNLLDNAIKYGGPGEITLSVHTSPSGVTISVSDTGNGVADNDRLRIFERYQRGENIHHGNGSGIGLTVSRMIAKSHEGTLDLTAPEKPGCTFSLHLPKLKALDSQVTESLTERS